MSYKKAARGCIDLSALQHNLHRVKPQASASKVMIVVKTNGYLSAPLVLDIELSECSIPVVIHLLLI